MEAITKHWPPRPKTVGIVGGGIAGLYTAALLKREGISYRIFEGTNRVGGRVRTHYFDAITSNQYFEAGAMRIPQTPLQKITFDLINWVNHAQGVLPSGRDNIVPVKLIPYNLTAPGNLLYVNGVHSGPSVTADNVTPNMIDWLIDDAPEGEEWGDIPAQDLLAMTIGKFKQALENAAEDKETPDEKFASVFESIIHIWDDYSFRHFLKTNRHKHHPGLFTDVGAGGASPKNAINDATPFPDSVIDFLETVTSQTNQFALSVPELIMQNLDFGTQQWQTIENGMSRLPVAMANVVGMRHIVFGARVRAICALADGELEAHPHGGAAIVATGYNGTLRMAFDAIVLAIPPAALKMLVSRPQWSPRKEMAIRSIHFEPLYKMGLRFKSRFWEKAQNRPDGEVNTSIAPSLGGQSTTDIPIRWIVYPSNDVGGKGPGVLLTYAWMTDATTWVPLSPIERRSLALHNIKRIYGSTVVDDEGNKVQLEELLIETADAVWSESTATGDAMFLPGQFRTRFEAARQPESAPRNKVVPKVDGRRLINPTIYFAGEHLSYHHTWIAGAADSALWTVRKMLSDQNIAALKRPEPLGHPIEEPNRSDLPRREPSPVPIDFQYTPSDPLHLHRSARHGYGDGDSRVHHAALPLSLGDGDLHGLGADIHCLRGPYAEFTI